MYSDYDKNRENKILHARECEERNDRVSCAKIRTILQKKYEKLTEEIDHNPRKQ